MIQSLAARGHQVFAGEIEENNIKCEDLVHVINFDITDYDQVRAAMRDIKPEGIIHLAARSMVKRSWEEPALTITVNTIGTVNIVTAVKEVIPDSKIINIGTSEEYGLTGNAGRALIEQDDCLPQNPYAISKLSAGQMALQLAKRKK